MKKIVILTMLTMLIGCMVTSAHSRNQVPETVVTSPEEPETTEEEPRINFIEEEDDVQVVTVIEEEEDYDGTDWDDYDYEDYEEYDYDFDDYLDYDKLVRRNSDVKFRGGIMILLGDNKLYYTRGSVDGKGAFSVGAGLTSQLTIKNFGLRPEVLYEYSNTKFPYGDIECGSLTVPFSFVYQTRERSKQGGFIAAGAFYRYRFNRKFDGDKVTSNEVLYRNEGGITFSVGVWISHFRLSYMGLYGMSDLLKDNTFMKKEIFDKANLRSRTNYFTLAYIF